MNRHRFALLVCKITSVHARQALLNVRPLHAYVIVRRKEEAHQTAGGIVMPDTATGKPYRVK
jgi:hypothetical protein